MFAYYTTTLAIKFVIRKLKPLLPKGEVRSLLARVDLFICIVK